MIEIIQMTTSELILVGLLAFLGGMLYLSLLFDSMKKTKAKKKFIASLPEKEQARYWRMMENL